MIIAIDGTTGSGKSTISKALAQKIGFAYIRTGSCYRAIALKILKEKVDYSNINEIKKLLSSTQIINKFDGKHVVVTMDGTDVSDKINTPEISNFVSKISSIHEVREYVRKLQQNSKKTCENIIMEGRDIGSVVFPNADLKVFIDCPIDVRAQRRVNQFKANNNSVSFEEAKKAIEIRDYDDTHRKESPLVRLPEAFYLDTSKFDIDGCVNELVKQIKKLQK